MSAAAVIAIVRKAIVSSSGFGFAFHEAEHESYGGVGETVSDDAITGA
jgi:hypothetical protein